MSRSGALSHGFKRVWNEPLLYCAELAWRWAYSAALITLVTYAIGLFLKSLPVSNRDLFGLSGIIPGLYLEALANIFRGSGPKIVRVIATVSFGSAVLWLLSSSWGRAATLANLRGGRIETPRVARFHFLRQLIAAFCFAAYVGSLLFAFSMSAHGRSHDLATFYLVLLPFWLVITLVRSSLGWWIALAPFVEQRSLLGTLFAAADLARARGRQFAWVNFSLGGLRFVLLVAAWSAAFTFAGIFASESAEFTYASWIIVVVAYSLIKNWINTWQLAAYVRIVEWDGHDVSLPPPAPYRPPLLEPQIVPAM